MVCHANQVDNSRSASHELKLCSRVRYYSFIVTFNVQHRSVRHSFHSAWCVTPKTAPVLWYRLCGVQPTVTNPIGDHV